MLRRFSTKARLALVIGAVGAAAFATVAVTTGDDGSTGGAGSHCAARAVEANDPTPQEPMACFDTAAERDEYLRDQGVVFPPGYDSTDD